MPISGPFVGSPATATCSTPLCSLVQDPVRPCLTMASPLLLIMPISVGAGVPSGTGPASAAGFAPNAITAVTAAAASPANIALIVLSSALRDDPSGQPAGHATLAGHVGESMKTIIPVASATARCLRQRRACRTLCGADRDCWGCGAAAGPSGSPAHTTGLESSRVTCGDMEMNWGSPGLRVHGG